MSKYKAILFDIDNTLYSYQPAHQKAWAQALNYLQKQTGLDRDYIEQVCLQSRDEIHDQLDETAASHNRLLYFQLALECLKVDVFPTALAVYRLYWDTFVKEAVLFDGVIDFFKQHQHKYKFAFVTDLTADVQHQKLNHFGLGQYVDALVTSEEVGIEKPHPDIFYRALDKLNLTSNDVCMVGDHYDKDIVGAKSLGMEAVWFNHEGQARNVDDVIVMTSFYDLERLLNE